MSEQITPTHYFKIHTYSKKIGKKELEKILLGLVDILEMVPLSEPYTAEGSASPGWTGMIMIETSHIAIHCFDETGEMWLDILSCKPFQEKKIQEFLKVYL